jgi:diaminohydroxyphosphoribosylaminopyrimidine deaminase/5-amino-6-(5-phosphoribosylamino)uracil reductase
MRRCLEIAAKAGRDAAPNPMVGCVIVHRGHIVAEGYHEKYGGPHAEVNAINSLAQKEILPECTLYVSLEPCSHFGKTPPCADLIIQSGIRRVVIGAGDSNMLVGGQGIDKLRAAGIEVECGVLTKECRSLNQRFYTVHEKARPYIILKWAQTADGFIDRVRNSRKIAPLQISGSAARELTHRWRSEEQAILVGTNTVLLDDPALTVRLINGTNPVRLLIDREGKIPLDSKVFYGPAETIVFSGSPISVHPPVRNEILDFSKSLLPQLFERLLKNRINSVFVEGGTATINHFLSSGHWDEARIFVSKNSLGEGLAAPAFPGKAYQEESVGEDMLLRFRNNESIY